MNTFCVSLLESYSTERMLNDCSGSEIGIWKDLYDSFVRDNCEKNPTAAFWSAYLQMVQLLLEFIRATRTSDWQLHLSTLRSMIPWFFATDRTNYARYAPCYWLEMSDLERSHPCEFIKRVQNFVTRTVTENVT